MGLVLWIDKNTFATSLLEKVFKKKEMPFYTLSSVADFSYLVDDLRPELIVLDAETALENLSSLQAQYNNSSALQKLPFILIDPKEGLEFMENKIGELRRPFDPFGIPHLLLEIFKKK